MKDDVYLGRRRSCRYLRRAFVALLAALCVYLYFVQVAEHEALAMKSERQQSRLAYLPAKRGAVLDRHGVMLNGSVPQYDVAVMLDKIRDPRDTRSVTLNKAQAAISELAVYLGPDFYAYRPQRQAIAEHIQQRAPLPFVLWTNVGLDVAERLTAASGHFPYAELSMTWCREYYHGEACSQLRGYVRRADARRTLLGKGISRMLNVKDVEGASGIEGLFNETLCGRSGYQKLVTDVLSYRKRIIETESAVMGSSVTLTIDLALQELAEERIMASGHPGAAVVMEVESGEVLVLASLPNHHLPPRAEDQALSGAFSNRAVSGYYPPGSTIKPFIALAALEQGVLKADETLYCPGYYELPDGRRIGCSSRYGHGRVNVTQALAVSCNAFFCEAGVRLGASGFERLRSDGAYNQFFGQKTGATGIRREGTGVLFCPSWVSSNREKEPAWRVGDSALGGIGQGGWIVTPLQMAVYACGLTTGRVVRPKLVRNHLPAFRGYVRWGEANWIAVLQGLSDCVQTARGTGRRLGLHGGICAYGKTGTAEHVSGREPHAWMFVSAPLERPRVVAVCVLEEGGHGGEQAAPILGAVLDAYFRRYAP